MGQVINTNLASLAAQRSLGNSQGDVQTALTRLSSGLRINSAKDDAAGLAISERFTSQIKGLNQAFATPTMPFLYRRLLKVLWLRQRTCFSV
jgi:flagellin